MSFKKIAGWLHLVLGLSSGLVVMVVALSGCTFVFEEEFRRMRYAEQWFVSAQPRPKLPPEAIVAAVARVYPGEAVKQVRLYADATRSAQVTLSNGRIISLEPYSGQVLGERAEHDFFHTVEQLHRTLLLGEFGKTIIHINVAIFFVMLVTGLVIWWPKTRKQFSKSLRVTWAAKWPRLTFELHGAGGFYASGVLFIIVLTGMWWAFKPIQKGIYALAGAEQLYLKKVSSTPVPGHAFAPEQAFALAAAQYPGWSEAAIGYPKDETEVIRVSLRYPSDWARKLNVLSFDQYSGQILKAELAAERSTADYIRHSNYDIHTGRILGLPGKILVFLAGLVAALLPVSGFLIWRNKRNAPKKRTTRTKGVTSRPA